MLLTTLTPNEADRSSLIQTKEYLPVVAAKTRWALEWLFNDKELFAVRLAAFAAIKGIFFTSSFASILWLKGRGIMPGLCMATELIARDERAHTEFACLMFSYAACKPKASITIQIITSAVDIEKSFARRAYTTEIESFCVF